MPLRSTCRCFPAWSWLLAAGRPACGSGMSAGGLPMRPGLGRGTRQAAALRWAGLALSRATCGLLEQPVAGLAAREQAARSAPCLCHAALMCRLLRCRVPFVCAQAAATAGANPTAPLISCAPAWMQAATPPAQPKLHLPNLAADVQCLRDVKHFVKDCQGLGRVQAAAGGPCLPGPCTLAWWRAGHQNHSALLLVLCTAC